MTLSENIIPLCICGDENCTVTYGLCHCGCGNPTPISAANNRPRGYIKGIPRMYLPWHCWHLTPPSLCVCGNKKCKIPFGYCHCGCGERTNFREGKYSKTKAGHHHLVFVELEVAAPFKIAGKLCQFIPLNDGIITIVSMEDFTEFSKYRWKAILNQDSSSYYVRRNKRIALGYWRASWMARELMGLGVGDTRQVDHKNGNTLDNRRDNLRICTKAENIRNRKRAKNNSSGFKGVSWSSTAKRWQAEISVNRLSIPLGYFDNPEDAHKAYCAAAIEHHGEFSRFS